MPVVGNVTLVAPVVVNVRAKLPAVVRELAVVKFPPTSTLPFNLIVLLLLITSNVSVLSEVKAVDDVDANVKSQAVVDVSTVCRVVNLPVEAVVAPMLTLLIVPNVDGFTVKPPAGDIVTVPVPDGLTVTVAFDGLNPTVELASNVVKFPAALVTVPIGVF